MASVSATCPRFQPLFSQSNKTSRAAGLKLDSVGWAKCTGFPPLKASRFRVSCSVEIVMTLEEEFDINVEEESSQNITTVQEVADMIEKLVQKKAEGES
uniref:Carrier domain-containing protein n=1 Tax=Populus trichocarpa TaxID=3694 RepID=A0A2K1XL20_POPTR